MLYRYEHDVHLSVTLVDCDHIVGLYWIWILYIRLEPDLFQVWPEPDLLKIWLESIGCSLIYKH